ncbi:hypothetical protein Tco_0677754 [Tanacetum coccineum]|uniref:Uncharacterized protein n=1 Tax=Tanacetum coccineum TaxID=301880 RepID=A0ABQ4XE89_9ASTR
MNKRISTRHWLKLMKVTSSFLTLMVTLSRLKDAEMMRIKMKKPLLDQTEGAREDELEKNQSQLLLQKKRHPRQLASQLMVPNLNTTKIPSPDRDWNKTLPAAHGPGWNNVVASQKYATSITMTKAADYRHIKWIEEIWSPTECGVKESARDVYSKRRIIIVTKIEIVEWHNYKHFHWITIRKDDDKLYQFKEWADFKRFAYKDIKDMLASSCSRQVYKSHH